MLNAKDGRISVGGTYIDYASFGRGKMILVILCGLSTVGVDGKAFMLANMYRMFAKEYTVYFLDRKNSVPEGYSVADMADDTAEAMRGLGIEHAFVYGVSQGGMIAQVLAEKYPHMVEKLVLCATLARQNDTIKATVGRWIELAEQGDFEAFNMDSFEKLFTEKYLKKNRLLLPAAAKIAPEDPARFLVLARACLTFDGYDELEKIKCPTLVIGARGDKVVTGEASEEIAEKLGCELYIYEGYGHAVYDEAKDIKRRIYDFLKKESPQ